MYEIEHMKEIPIKNERSYNQTMLKREKITSISCDLSVQCCLKPVQGQAQRVIKTKNNTADHDTTKHPNVWGHN